MNSQVEISSDGKQAMASVVKDVGIIGQPRNRNLAAVSSLDPVAAAADVNEAFWPEAADVRQLEAELNVVSGTLLYVKVVFNVLPDETKSAQRLAARAMLAAGNSSSDDVQWEKIIFGKEFIRRFRNKPLRNCFMQAVGTTPIVGAHLGGR